MVEGFKSYEQFDLSQKATLKSAVVHPDYDHYALTHVNDIAIITFTEPLELNDKVQLIAWNQDEDVTFVGEMSS